MLKKFSRRILFSRTTRRLIGWANHVVLPGFEGFSLYKIGRFYTRAIQKGSLVTRASSISFKLFLAFFPTVIMLLSFIPFIPVDDLQIKLLRSFETMLPPEVYDFIEGTLTDLVIKKKTTLLSLSFLVVLYLASNSLNAILVGFSGSFNLIKKNSPVKQRALSLLLLIALTVLLIVVMALLTLSNGTLAFLQEHGLWFSGLEGWFVHTVRWVLSLLLVMMSISMLFYAGDPQSSRFKLFSPGAILSTILFVVASEGLAWVFANITDYNALYGSIGAIIAVQLWIYINMIVLLVGFELNTSISWARATRKKELQQVKPAHVK